MINRFYPGSFLQIRKRIPCSNKIVRSHLQGGLGNQLFQFAAAVEYAIKKDALIEFRFSDSKRKFELDFISIDQEKVYRPSISRGMLVLTPLNVRDECAFEVFSEKEFRYSEIKSLASHLELRGYFQSDKYFMNIGPELRNFLREKLEIAAKTEDIDIHIRLGDYFFDEKINKVHGVLPENYFMRALEYFGSRSSKVHLYSDSPELVGKLFPNLYQIGQLSTLTSFETFRALSSSKNLVISNSTFGWWAGWISSAVVVAPKLWFNPLNEQLDSTDLLTTDWTWLECL
jgi:hypothetical protein